MNLYAFASRALLGLVGAGLLFVPMVDAKANGNVHVSRFWHNHQPIYWPEWNSNGSQNQRGQYAWDSIVLKPGQNYGGLSPRQHPENNLTDIFGLDDRRAAYQGRPRDSLASFSGGGFAMSYSGSLIDNIRQLGGVSQLGYGSGWAGGNREAKSAGRLDLVGFTYHHSLAPLLPKEVFRKEIQAFKQAWWKAWNGQADGSDHSKGFFPTEMAYSRHLIDVLVDEGYEWVIVASHHISRTSPGYNTVANPQGSYNIFSSPPNKSDQLSPTFNSGWWYSQPNPGNAAWNVSPFAYQLHKVKYVNPETGAEKDMIAVPSDDVLSYRFGYANEGISKIQSEISPFATDPNRPVIVMPSTDGDNAWGGGYSSWMEATPQYFNQSAGAGYIKTMPGAFVNAHKAHAPVTHIEDGAWIFPESDYGSPYFLKWIEPPLGAKGAPGNYPGTFVDLETPGFALKFFSYAPLMAGANYVITAEQIWKDGGGVVRPEVIQDPHDWDGNGYGDRNPIERAWHIYLKGLDSGFNYYGGLGNDDEVKPGLATKNASDLLLNFINANITEDRTPPTVLKPQRFPYNPGWYTFGWFNSFGTGTNAAFLKRMPSEFYVWTHAFDVSGISSVNLKVRIDHDGVNTMTNNQNETYAGGPDVGAWITIPMTQRELPKTRAALNARAANGEIDYFVFDPSLWPEPKVADYYFAKITDNNLPGFRGKLLDYYIEATDTRANVHKSEIQHVWVENDGGSSSTESSAAFSTDPRDCAPLTVTYTANQGPLSNSAPVKMWISFTGGAPFTSYVMTNLGVGIHRYTVDPVPDNAPSALVYFQNSDETITDNRGGQNWSTAIRDCDAPQGPVWTTPSPPVAGQSVTITYNPAGRVLASATSVNIHYGYNGSNWTTPPGVPMTQAGPYWTFTYSVPSAATGIVMAFNQNNNPWDNNGGQDFRFAVEEGEPPPPPPPPPPTGFVITNPPSDLVVGNVVEGYDLQGVADNAVGLIRWTNALTGGAGTIPAANPWTISALPLGIGDNVITVMGTNAGSSVVTSVVDSASNYTSSTWTNGANQGAGFGAWALNTIGTAGRFIAGNGFGFWAQTASQSEAIRPISSPLASGQKFSVTWKNGSVNISPSQRVGMALRNSNGDSLIQFFFDGGESFYKISDANTERNTSIGWTDQPQNIEVEILSATNYRMTVGSFITNGAFSGVLSQIRFWSTNGGEGSGFDFFVNNPKIISASTGSGASTSATVTITRQAAGDGDTNGDGIPDWWYARYGIDPATPGLAGQTTLGGQTYWEEYVYDTNPTNPASTHSNRIVFVSADDALSIRMEAPTSTGRWYDVYWATSLFNGVWTPMNFNLPGRADQNAILFTITNTPPVGYYRTGPKLLPPRNCA
jgi:hypothetical protein